MNLGLSLTSVLQKPPITHLVPLDTFQAEIFVAQSSETADFSLSCCQPEEEEHVVGLGARNHDQPLVTVHPHELVRSYVEVPLDLLCIYPTVFRVKKCMLTWLDLRYNWWSRFLM